MALSDPLAPAPPVASAPSVTKTDAPIDAKPPLPRAEAAPPDAGPLALAVVAPAAPAAAVAPPGAAAYSGAATPVSDSAASQRSAARPPLFSRQLFTIVTLLLAFQLALLVGNLWFQLRNYTAGIALAQQSGATADAVSLILIYSRAWDFAVTKTSALFLGFMVIYTGALYVLRSADTAYEISLTQGAQLGATLKSSSPGLAMIALGSGLVALVLHNKSEVGFQISASPAAPGVHATSASSAASEQLAPPRPRPAEPPAHAPAASDGGALPPEDRRIPKLLDPR